MYSLLIIITQDIQSSTFLRKCGGCVTASFTGENLRAVLIFNPLMENPVWRSQCCVKQQSHHVHFLFHQCMCANVYWFLYLC